MTDTAIETEPLTTAKLDLYCEVAAGVVKELRDFLAAHHVDLIRATDTPNKWGESMDMPEAFKDPAYAGRIHNLRIACDSFVDVMRGNL